MKNRNTLLIGVSIVMILLGTFALIADILDILNPEQGIRIISSMAASIICIVAGFFGILSKSRKNILIVSVLLLLITTIDVVVGTGFFDMSLFHLTLFAWPILYFLGWKISNRE